jgi:hypothetical protein
MSWNYRVVRHKVPDIGGLPQYAALGIHEVYYEPDGVTPKMVSKNAIPVWADNFSEGAARLELKDTLEKMLACLGKPILDYDEIGKSEEPVIGFEACGKTVEGKPGRCRQPLGHTGNCTPF